MVLENLFSEGKARAIQRSFWVALLSLSSVDLIFPEAHAADEKKDSKWSVGIFTGLTEANCASSLTAAFKAQGLSPDKDPKLTEAIQSACKLNSKDIVLVIPEKERSNNQTLSFDVTGSASSGNARSGALSAGVGYKRKFTNHTLDLKVNGAWLIDSEDTLYASYTLQADDELIVSNHWAIFTDVSVGQDTRKGLDFTAKELIGATFNLFGKDHKRQVKFSGAVGHRYEIPLSGSQLPTENNLGFSNNNAISSWRVKYEESFLDDALQVMSALWFQHILFSPETGQQARRFVDLSDYRTLFQLSIKVKIAEMGGAKIYSNLEGSYEYYARPFTNSPYDLQVQGGLGVQF